jgi:hypothetical protein
VAKEASLPAATVASERVADLLRFVDFSSMYSERPAAGG